MASLPDLLRLLEASWEPDRCRALDLRFSLFRSLALKPARSTDNALISDLAACYSDCLFNMPS